MIYAACHPKGILKLFLPKVATEVLVAYDQGGLGCQGRRERQAGYKLWSEWPRGTGWNLPSTRWGRRGFGWLEKKNIFLKICLFLEMVSETLYLLCYDSCKVFVLVFFRFAAEALLSGVERRRWQMASSWVQTSRLWDAPPLGSRRGFC